MIKLISCRSLMFMAIGTALAAFSGCSATVPSSLDRARVNLETAQRDPQISGNAPLALQDAAQAMRRAERAWNDTRNKEEVDHLADLADRRTEIARVMAERKIAEGETQRLGQERDKIVMEARQREAERARRQAEAQARVAEQEAERQARNAELVSQEARAQARDAEVARQQAEARAREAEQARQQAETATVRITQLEQQLAEFKARQTERGLELTLSGVLFEFDKATLKPGALRNLSPLITFLQEDPERKIVLEGHTDSVGSDSYNMELAQKRAESVRNFLIQSGIASHRIAAHGLGKGYPVASNDTEAGRLQNRRVEIIISNEASRSASIPR